MCVCECVWVRVCLGVSACECVCVVHACVHRLQDRMHGIVFDTLCLTDLRWGLLVMREACHFLLGWSVGSAGVCLLLYLCQWLKAHTAVSDFVLVDCGLNSGPQACRNGALASLT